MSTSSDLAIARKRNVFALASTALVASALVSTASFAQLDVSAATGAFTQAETAVGSIGPLMLTVLGAGIVFKWVAAFLI